MPGQNILFSNVNVNILLVISGTVFFISIIILLYIRSVKSEFDNTKELRIKDNLRIELRITETEKDIEKNNNDIDELFNRLRYLEQIAALTKLTVDNLIKQHDRNHG